MSFPTILVKKQSIKIIENEDKVSNGCQANFDEENKDEFASDEEEDLYRNYIGCKPNTKDAQI